MNDYNEVYAVPGAHTIIDAIHPATGLTLAFGSTEAEVKARNPGAVRMTYAAWQAGQIARQQTPLTWAPTTAEQYTEMLDILPPAAMIGGAFLVGEPADHCYETGRPRFEAYWQRGAEYVVSSRPVTVTELRKAIRGY